MSVHIPANVLHWNAETVIVSCPYCNHKHSHHFGPEIYSKCNRRSDCGHGDIGGIYQLSFPFDKSTSAVGFRIDKVRGWYLREGHTIKDLESSTGSSPRRASTPERKRWTEGERIHVIGNEDEGFRRLKEHFGSYPDETTSCLEITYAVSRLVNGDKIWLETYLRDSPEVALFLNGMDRDGSTALHLAACESSHVVVKLLLAHGCDVDATNREGRTPLMEAALWGRIRNAFLLLEAGAQTNIVDNSGRRAIDLAQASQETDDERFARVEHLFEKTPNKGYKPHQRSAERRQIVDMLEGTDKNALCNEMALNYERGELRFKNNLERCSVSLVKEFPVPNMWKTVARLVYMWEAPCPFSPVDAMSGWKDSTRNTLVKGLDWTAHVMQLASAIGYRLSADATKDQGVQEQYNACHAEKQLVAYFVENHVVLESDAEELTQVMPPVASPKATILVSRPVCPDCGRFIEEVNRQLGLGLQNEYIGGR